MLHIAISASGKLDKPHWREACDEYIKRLAPFCKLEFFTAGDAEQPKRADKYYAVALTPDGGSLTSEEFAAELARRQNICFYIGGSDGLTTEFVSRCDARLSLSAMTFPHALARVILLEQLYRAFQIMNNTRYHK
ncbi:ribosomal RNA large subunit methyltransferase H [Clostridia bacterium]|nr:ribosomal RNA large subunit methyltransferase H [Clostridia bacterium]